MNLKSLLVGQADISERSVSAVLLLLRTYAGFTIMMAGLDKLPLTDWMVDQVSTMGFPFPTVFAWLATFSEFAFGLLLIVGLLTRISGLMLAVTMGVASFGFQKVIPIIDMHIAQHFFWIFVLFIFTGAGRYSLDFYLFNSHSMLYAKIIPAVLVILLAVAMYIEFTPKEIIKQEAAVINSINVAGSFNDWDPTVTEMEMVSENDYELKLNFEKVGTINFKFTANRSWDINWGETDQSSKGFPISGKAELDEGNETQNISSYIPSPGLYKLIFNKEKLEYMLDSIKTAN